MAQAFSSTLDSVFALDSDVDHLSQTIDQKRFQMIIKTRELEELQAKIRETERRLKARQSLIVDGNGSGHSAGAPKVDNEYRTAGKEK
jgi:peptidoglycan hydrolase CwlO-like protein